MVTNHQRNTSFSKFRIIFFFFLSILMILCTFMNNGTAATSSEKIDTYLQDQKQKMLIPGIAVGVIQNGQIIYADGLGKANNAKTPVTNRTLFMLGEISQTITAMGVLALQEDGLIELNETIQKYIPSFELSDPEYSSQITIQQCLTHQTGISIKAGSADIKVSSIQELVNGLKSESFQSAPGENFEFSNANYWILGYLIEQVTNQSFSNYITTRILSPLGMQHTFFSQAEAENQVEFAQGYRLWYGIAIPSQLSYSAAQSPANGMVSNIEDILVLMQAHLFYKNSSFTHNVLMPSSFELLHAIPQDPLKNSSWTMGWYNFTFNGIKYLAQSGDLGDYHAEIFLTPENQEGVVVFTNVNSFFGNQGYYRNLADSIYNILNDKQPYSPIFSHMVLYILIDSIMFIGLGRDVWKFLGLKKGINLKMREKLLKKEKKQVILVEILMNVFSIILIMVLLPLFIGIFAGISGNLVQFFAQYQPDLFVWMILMSLSQFSKAIYTIISFRQILF
ncbi:MAG: beta-lactamase family protein [Candidatus Lokiarchaeota archaeon]|nr:beta-lactamase family protein [Candidatus Harpocratesius repetitus]